MRMGSFLILLGLFLLPPGAWAGDNVSDKGKTYNIPYRLTDTSHVLVRVKINGKGPFHYIIDTGAPFTLVATEVGKKLGLKPDDQGWAVVERFEVEGGAVNTKVKVRVDTPFQLEGMNGLNFAGVELHGIIGFDQLARYRMAFDFTHHKMQWTRLDFTPPPPVLLQLKPGDAAGLSAMSGMVKLLTLLVGKKSSPELVPAGFLGLELVEKGDQLFIDKIYPQSPAEKAGLKAGDQLLQVQGERVHTVKEVSQQTEKLAPGGEVGLTVRRGEKELRVVVTAGQGL